MPHHTCGFYFSDCPLSDGSLPQSLFHCEFSDRWRLDALDGAEFWLSEESPDHGNLSSESPGGGSVRMILTVSDPDAVFAQALEAGASQVFPVGEEHGWRLGRVVDPFGHHWEIGRQLEE